PCVSRNLAPVLPPSFPTRRSSDLFVQQPQALPRQLSSQRADARHVAARAVKAGDEPEADRVSTGVEYDRDLRGPQLPHHCVAGGDRKSTRLNSSHDQTSYAVFCLK